MKKIAYLKEGDIVEGNFVVKFKKPIERYINGYCFQLRIGDVSGEIMLKYWGGNNEESVTKLYDSIEKDDVIFVKGKVVRFKGKLEIDVDENGEIRRLKEGEYNIREFIEVSEKDIENMFNELMIYANNIKNKDVKKILSIFINDFNFVEKFKKQPAAMYKHHSWIGGLLEHTLNVVKIVDHVCSIHKEIDKDIAITGAILHDIGKIKEFDMKTSIKTSKHGMLLGHVVLGVEEVLKRLQSVDIDEEIKMKIIHIIISHHGRFEFGAVKQPAFPEALIVFLADYMDSKISEMIMHRKRAKTEDEYIYIKEFGLIYLG